MLVYRGGSRVDSRTGLSAATTSLQFTGLDNSSEYSFAVVAHNAMGASDEGARSTPLVAYGKPGQVSGVSVAFADASARVSFSPAQDNGSAITTYRVTSPQGAAASCASSPCTVSGLTNGTNYTFTVTAENAAGAGPASVATAAGSPFGPPRTPTINANASGTTVSFSWDSNAQSYANGRQITSMDVTFERSAVANNGSFSRDIGYSATGTLTIRVCAAEGGCREATQSARTGAEPYNPSVQASQTGSPGGGWDHGYRLTLNGFRANSTVTCSFAITEGGGVGTQSWRVGVDGAGNAVTTVQMSDGVPIGSNKSISVDAPAMSCDGVRASY